MTPIVAFDATLVRGPTRDLEPRVPRAPSPHSGSATRPRAQCRSGGTSRTLALPSSARDSRTASRFLTSGGYPNPVVCVRGKNATSRARATLRRPPRRVARGRADATTRARVPRVQQPRCSAVAAASSSSRVTYDACSACPQKLAPCWRVGRCSPPTATAASAPRVALKRDALHAFYVDHLSRASPARRRAPSEGRPAGGLQR